MFLGQYDHLLDQKNRVIVPQRFREIEDQAGAVWSEFILTRGPEHCIFIYTPPAWKKLQAALFSRAALPGANRRKFQRLLYAGGAGCTCDRQGRIVVPPKLREHAGLTRQVTWIGAGDHAELWDTDRWREYEAAGMELFQDTFDHMAEDMNPTAPPEPEEPDTAT